MALFQWPKAMMNAAGRKERLNGLWHIILTTTTTMYLTTITYPTTIMYPTITPMPTYVQVLPANNEEELALPEDEFPVIPNEEGQNEQGAEEF